MTFHSTIIYTSYIYNTIYTSYIYNTIYTSYIYNTIYTSYIFNTIYTSYIYTYIAYPIQYNIHKLYIVIRILYILASVHIVATS